MNRFDFIRPASLAEALAAGKAPGSVYLASGTNLLELMKLGVTRPERVIDIARLPELAGVSWALDGGVRIGAAVRNSDLADDARFRRAFPAIAEALLSGGSPQLRNAATVGGNLMQRTRCAYFQDVVSACNRRAPGSGCDARGGENRLHAVLGWSPQCIAVHPSDFCVPLTALDVIAEVAGPHGLREIAVEALHALPGDTPERETALTPGELVIAIRIPAAASAFREHARFLKVRERTAFAPAVVSAVAALEVHGGAIQRARIALGGVAGKPWRARDAEASLEGAPISAESFARAADLALAGAQPSGDNGFKIELARRLVVRALRLASEGTPEVMPAIPGSPLSKTRGAIHAS